jgi:hypothetical protein
MLGLGQGGLRSFAVGVGNADCAIERWRTKGSAPALSRERDASTDRSDPRAGAGSCDSLIAKRETRHGKPVDRFDIRMQGDKETVFFEV